MSCTPVNLRSRVAGFTLIELMLTIIIAATLLVIGVPSFIEFERNSELTSANNVLVGAMNTARGEAMKRGMNAIVVPTDGTTWKNGWTVFVDQNRNFTYDAATDVTVLQQAALPDYFDVTGSGSAGDTAPYIMFDASGYAKTKTAGFGALSLSIARNDVSASELARQTRRIIVSTTGRPRSCRPDLDPTCTATALE